MTKNYLSSNTRAQSGKLKIKVTTRHRLLARIIHERQAPSLAIQAPLNVGGVHEWRTSVSIRNPQLELIEIRRARRFAQVEPVFLVSKAQRVAGAQIPAQA